MCCLLPQLLHTPWGKHAYLCFVRLREQKCLRITHTIAVVLRCATYMQVALVHMHAAWYAYASSADDTTQQQQQPGWNSYRAPTACHHSSSQTNHKGTSTTIRWQYSVGQGGSTAWVQSVIPCSARTCSRLSSVWRSGTKADRRGAPQHPKPSILQPLLSRQAALVSWLVKHSSAVPSPSLCSDVELNYHTPWLQSRQRVKSSVAE